MVNRVWRQNNTDHHTQIYTEQLLERSLYTKTNCNLYFFYSSNNYTICAFCCANVYVCVYDIFNKPKHFKWFLQWFLFYVVRYFGMRKKKLYAKCSMFTTNGKTKYFYSYSICNYSLFRQINELSSKLLQSLLYRCSWKRRPEFK